MSYLLFYLIAINVIAFAAMGIDKAKARAGKWRIAESTLFALAPPSAARAKSVPSAMRHLPARAFALSMPMAAKAMMLMAAR